MDKVIEHYLSTLTVKGLLKNNNKAFVLNLYYLNFPIIVVWIVGDLFYFYAKEINVYVLGFNVICLMLTATLINYFNNTMRSIVKKLFDETPKKFMWNSDKVLEELKKYKIEKLELYIKNEGLDLNELKSDFKEKTALYKPPFPVFTTFIVTISVLYIEKFTGKFLDLYIGTNPNMFQSAMIIVGIIYALIILLAYFIYRFIFIGIILDAMNSKYQNIVYLSQLIQEVNLYNGKPGKKQ